MSGSRTATSRRPAAAAADRFAARSRRPRWRGVVYGGLATLAVVAAVGTVWLVGWSELTALRTVTVEGADDALVERVSDAAAAPLREQLIRVDTDAVAARVRELPELAEVSVRRSWPRTLVVSVIPRVPAAAIREDGSWWQVDRTGVLFGRSSDQPAALPVLDAPGDGAAKATRAAGVAVLIGLPADVRDLVAGVSAHSPADVRLKLSSGATVRWGGPDHGADKAAVLLRLLGEDATNYDVSAPTRPALTP